MDGHLAVVTGAGVVGASQKDFCSLQPWPKQSGPFSFRLSKSCVTEITDDGVHEFSLIMFVGNYKK